jgi:hypothetical protein
MEAVRNVFTNYENEKIFLPKSFLWRNPLWKWSLLLREEGREPYKEVKHPLFHKKIITSTYLSKRN